MMLRSLTDNCFMKVNRISQNPHEVKPTRAPVGSRIRPVDTTICRARERFSQDQLNFLARKASGAMPYGCENCDGCGMQACSSCSGSGQNAADLAEKLFDLKNIGVHQRAPDINVNYMFMEGMPCFICKGAGTCPCSACSGTGMANFAANFTPSD
jgi:hypothetical protein